MATNLIDLNGILRAIGRGIVFLAGSEGSAGFDFGYWDGTSPLVFQQLGDTEGNIVLNPNAATAGLTLPELTGPAMHEADFLGENPTVEIPMVLADPTLRSVVNPLSQAHGGQSMRQPVKEHTLIIVPEMVLAKADANGILGRASLSYDGADFLLNEGEEDEDTLAGDALALFEAGAVWCWRGYFSKPPRTFRGGAGDEKKDIETVTFQLLHDATKPAGQALYTVGNPVTAGVDIAAGS